MWFGDEPVFGVNADDGKWRHPPDDCGRDQKEVPAEAERTGMWNCKVEGRKGDAMPIAGRKYNCHSAPGLGTLCKKGLFFWRWF